MSDKKPKKKFKNTKVGQFLTEKVPSILGIAGELLPDAGVLGMVKSLIEKEPALSPVDKEHALKLLEQDMVEMQEVSKRWEADMTSDSWLSKKYKTYDFDIFNYINGNIYVIGQL